MWRRSCFEVFDVDVMARRHAYRTSGLGPADLRPADHGLKPWQPAVPAGVPPSDPGDPPILALPITAGGRVPDEKVLPRASTQHQTKHNTRVPTILYSTLYNSLRSRRRADGLGLG